MAGGDVGHVGECDLEAFRGLRRALRDLAGVVTEDTRDVSGDRDLARAVAEVNAAVRQTAAWPQLEVVGGELVRRTASAAPGVVRVLAAIAAEGVELFGGERRSLLRACYAPGCVLYFVKDHPRREWCSPGCGNRVRAARHYRRVTSREHG
ncbi:hypothetical protein BN6_32600 [Saccharothrix espanaensis DSM 44229]|uniref:Zinc finger CGNR domain-containing protein n=1 Tax=Saccharothrix espanaensis (strain ATCC 51144 / DSM 44229 / JCM 9112 / NBRC 15066 / NRRL 15764) TaxID=1179773 RepID=K0K139_SACES|nr:hypothetical protein BN6_32600 [Saccharothrix espanaensis DSM 44229]